MEEIIVYCPLHASAEQMRGALEEASIPYVHEELADKGYANHWLKIETVAKIKDALAASRGERRKS